MKKSWSKENIYPMFGQDQQLGSGDFEFGHLTSAGSVNCIDLADNAARGFEALTVGVHDSLIHFVAPFSLPLSAV
jgi:hypothetical protein